MKKIIIAFDVDGTLIRNDVGEHEIVPNERIIELLKILSSFKNIKIVVWSGRGVGWASSVGLALGLRKYVTCYATKNHIGKDKDGKHQFDPEIIPDICIDDIQDCNLGMLNLIVKEK